MRDALATVGADGSAAAWAERWSTADVEIGVISASLCHLANISYRLGGRLLTYDAAAQKFADAEANRLAHPSYRAPYVVPKLA